jgi:hypothetical protein
MTHRLTGAHRLVCAALLCLSPDWASAEGLTDHWQDMWQDTRALRWESGLLVGGTAVIGLRDWNWGSQPTFNTRNEGWFGPDTDSGGTDKLAHAYSAYFMTNGLAEQLQRQGRSSERAALSATLLTQAVLLGVELFDGYSVNYGWSNQDVVMNLLGSGAAYLRQTQPKLRERIDVRLEYRPSGYRGFSPVGDYAGQKYLVAFKLSGLDATRDSPLRYLELHAGYYARGFSPEEVADGRSRSRQGFVGIGLNLNALLWGARHPNEPPTQRYGRLFFEHIQMPATAFHAP